MSELHKILKGGKLSKGIPVEDKREPLPVRSESTGLAPDYKAIAEWLYMVLDDIDSADDMAKENDSLYRKTVHKLQRLKNEVGCSPDGQVLEFRNPQQDYGLTRLFGPSKPTPYPNRCMDSKGES